MQVLLKIEDKMAFHLMEVLKSLPYVEAKMISNENALFIEELKEAFEEVKLIKQGKLKGIPAKELLDEL